MKVGAIIVAMLALSAMWLSGISADAQVRPDTTQPYWMNIGPRPTVPNVSTWGHTSGRINTVVVKPDNPNVVLVGGSNGGIWRSSDGGVTFKPVADDQMMLPVGSIAFAPNNPSIVYAGMGDGTYLGYGILRSNDGGQSWTHVNNDTFPAYITARKVVVDPTDPNRVNVAVQGFLAGPLGGFSAGGFYLSTDGGVNWTRTLMGVGRDMVIDPANRLTLYGAMASAVTPGTVAAGVYRSTDGGLTWGTAPFFSVPYQPTQEVKVAMSALDSRTLWVYTGDISLPSNSMLAAVTTGSGAAKTWVAGPALIDTGDFPFNTYLATDPANASSIYIGARDVFNVTRNADDSLTFSNLTHNYVNTGVAWALALPATVRLTSEAQHAIAFSPADPKVFYCANDGGLYKSPDGGVTFQSLNDSLTLQLVNTLTVDPNDASLLFAGIEDNGLERKTPNSATWNVMITGDGGNIVIDPLDNSIISGVTTGGFVFRFLNRGQTSNGFVANIATFGEPSGGRVGAPPAFAGNWIDQTLYYASWRVFTSKDLGVTWTPLGAADLTRGGQDRILLMNVSPMHPEIIFTASQQRRVMMTSNGGVSWNDVSAGLPARGYTGITIDNTNLNVAYLVVGGYGTDHVFKTLNSGANWTDITGNLPNTPAHALLVDPLNPNILYLGTDIGVFQSDASGSNWVPFNNGLPPVPVTSFAAQPGGLIRIGTYGRGVYELVRPAASQGTPFQIVDRGGVSMVSTGASSTVSVGHGRIQPDSISASPSGIAIFGFRQNGVLVSETGVPASAALTSGRIYAEIGGSVNTGIAISNPNSAAVTLSFNFTDALGNPGGPTGNMTIPANGQVAQFLDQAPLKTYTSATFQGAFSFTSSLPVGVVALRGFTNERGEFLMSTLPVVDTKAAARTGVLVIPHYADGGGWATQIFLVNPTDNTLTGTLSFDDPSGRPATVTIGGTSGVSFQYSIPGRSSQKFALGGARATTASGQIRVFGGGGVTDPVPMVLFSYKPAGVTVSEAGVPVVMGTAIRTYVESSSPQSGNIQSGIAVATVSGNATTAVFEITDLNGTPVDGIAPVSLTLPSLGQTAKFLGDIFPKLPAPFKGVLRITATPSPGVSVVGLRTRVNERGDFLITTTPPSLESATPPGGDLLFPHFVDGGGYTTQFILFSGTTSQPASGTLKLLKQDGGTLNLPLAP